MLIFILSTKLYTYTREAWSQCADSEKKGVTIDQFLKFFTSRCDTTHTQRSAVTHHAHAPLKRDELKCASCTQAYPLFRCRPFMALDLASLREFLKLNKLCFNFLSPTQMAGNCLLKHPGNSYGSRFAGTFFTPGEILRAGCHWKLDLQQRWYQNHFSKG